MFRGALATVHVARSLVRQDFSKTKTERITQSAKRRTLSFFDVEVTLMVANVEVQSALEALANVHHGAS